MIDHDMLVLRSYELTPLSPTVARLAEMASDATWDTQVVVKTLSMDPALSGSVLRQANSARFGGRHEIATVQDAVVRLGPAVILELATRTSLRGTADRSLPEFGFTEGMFWRHCCAAAIAVDVMRRRTRTGLPAAANSAALLHDIGKLAMAQFLSPDDLRLMWQGMDQQAGCAALEREILGVDHAEVGRLIAQYWRLPVSIQEGIAHHHEPDLAPSPIVDVVHVASCIADQACRSLHPHSGQHPSDNALKRLQINPSDVADMSASVLAELGDTTSG